MQRVHFQKVNGFSNKFYGWGAEDDDMYERISNVGLMFVRFDPSISTYVMLPHQSSRYQHSDHQLNPQLQAQAGEKTSTDHDGLSSLSYQVVDHQVKNLFTWFLVSC